MLSHMRWLTGRGGLLAAFGFLMALLLAFGGVFVIVEKREETMVAADRQLGDLALILASETTSILRGAELVQGNLIDDMRERGIESPEALEHQATSFEIHRDLRRRIAGLPSLASLAVLDRNGHMLNNSRTWPIKPIDASSQDFFLSLSANPSLSPTIGQPFRNAYTGEWTIVFAQSFVARDGRLIGLVASTIELEHLEAAFSRVLIRDDGSFAWIRRDGIVLMRYPSVPSKPGLTLAGTEVFSEMLSSLDQNAVRQHSPVDGKGRLVFARSVDRYPIIVAVTRSVSELLREWHREVLGYGAVTMVLELALAAGVVFAIRYFGKLEELRAAEAAQAHWQRFGVVLNTMRQGVCMFDQSNRVVVANRRSKELFGMPLDDTVQGLDYREVTERIVAHGAIALCDMNELRERRKFMMETGKDAEFDWELSDGRTITVTHQLMTEGWLTTYDDITERCRAESQMAHMARHDALTDLPNRLLFRERLASALVHAKRGRVVALLCLDLDQFKTVNDTLGHPVGDELLKALARRFSACVREMDTVARLGGDEFAIIQCGLGKRNETTALAERLLDLSRQPIDIDGHQIVTSSSIGITFAPQDGLDTDCLLRCADLALYQAKAAGRGTYRLFHPSMDLDVQERRLLEHDLRQALELGEFEIFYQPFVGLSSQAVTGFEALLRWHHPERGLVLPGTFISAAEDIGLVLPIGEWALTQACKTAADWPGELRVSVNLSPAQFRSPDLVKRIRQALLQSGLAPGRLEIEITETILLEETQATVATLRTLHGLGVRIAMDDFGTGYSSLSYLRRFSFDRIKIDQGFVAEITRRRDCMAIVRAVATLGNELDIETTAEGVETHEQLAALAAAGCREVQGHLFSPAVSASQIAGLLGRLNGACRGGVVGNGFKDVAVARGMAGWYQRGGWHGNFSGLGHDNECPILGSADVPAHGGEGSPSATPTS